MYDIIRSIYRQVACSQFTEILFFLNIKTEKKPAYYYIESLGGGARYGRLPAPHATIRVVRPLAGIGLPQAALVGLRLAESSGATQLRWRCNGFIGTL